MPRRGRVKPLGSVTPIWLKNGSEYPVTIRVPMHDGHVINYHAENLEHGSVLKASLDAFDRACKHKKKPMPLTEDTSFRG